MCEHSEEYIEQPAITVGGPTGDYFVNCPISSNRWAEFLVESVSNGDGGTGSVVISGNGAPKAMAYDGTKTISDTSVVMGKAYRVPQTTTYFPQTSFERITNSQKRVYIRIDAAANTSMFVAIRFREKVLDRIPGPSHTVHPDHMENLNQARAEATTTRLTKMGIPGYAEEK